MNDENILLQQVLSVASAIEIAKIHKGEEFDPNYMTAVVVNMYDSLVKKIEK